MATVQAYASLCVCADVLSCHRGQSLKSLVSPIALSVATTSQFSFAGLEMHYGLRTMLAWFENQVQGFWSIDEGRYEGKDRVDGCSEVRKASMVVCRFERRRGVRNPEC